MLFILAQMDKYNKCQISLFRRAGKNSSPRTLLFLPASCPRSPASFAPEKSWRGALKVCEGFNSGATIFKPSGLDFLLKNDKKK